MQMEKDTGCFFVFSVAAHACLRWRQSKGQSAVSAFSPPAGLVRPPQPSYPVMEMLLRQRRGLDGAAQCGSGSGSSSGVYPEWSFHGIQRDVTFR